jgi:putative hydroxymethylpyrimidine transport system substrate-binding protein
MDGKQNNEVEELIMIKKSVFVLILAAISLLSACGGTESEGTHVEEELPVVDIMLDWYPNAVHSYLYAAMEQGYFEEEGVNVNIKFPANPTDPINLAATGDITLGITYQPDVIMARAKDLPVVSVAAIVRSPLNHMIYLPDSGIQSPKDLEGKKVGYPGIPVNEPLLKTMIEADGGDMSKVELIDVGFELGSSLVSENVDAVIGAYINHEVPVLKHKGYEVDYFNPVDYGVPNFYELVIVTNEETWKGEEEAIRAFWKGATKGFNYMQENPKESLDLLMSHQDQANFPLIREVEEQSLDILLPKMETSEEAFGSQSKDSWQETIDWLKNGGLITDAPDVNEIFVNLVK